MQGPSPAQLRELLDRQEILDCIYRYCRGFDRLDRDLVLSCYHEGAYQENPTFFGSAAEFVDFTLSRHNKGATQAFLHYVTNHTAEIDGDVAHAETYFFAAVTVASPEDGGARKVEGGGGRYIDRFERREGRWGIVDRVCLAEWRADFGQSVNGLPMTLTGQPFRNKSDLSYQRPLRLDRAVKSFVK